MPLPGRQPRLRRRRQDTDQKPGVDRQLPAGAKLTGQQQGLIVSTLLESAGMEGDRNEKIGCPGGRVVTPGRIEETGERSIESKAAVEFETMDRVTQRVLVKAGGDSPGEIRRVKEAFPTNMIAPADGGKGKSTARTTRRREG